MALCVPVYNGAHARKKPNRALINVHYHRPNLEDGFTRLCLNTDVIQHRSHNIELTIFMMKCLANKHHGEFLRFRCERLSYKRILINCRNKLYFSQFKEQTSNVLLIIKLGKLSKV